MDERIESVLPAQGSTHNLKLQFTGSGSEYFRIWIVNLLLTLVTIGIYFPWAKVRKLRYFYGNTLVGGEPLGFHGDPKKMFKGYALVALFFICYSVVKELSPVAGLLGLVLAAALWPALMKSSLQFRLGNTSWRGLRFHFAGDLAGAYRATLPFFIPAAAISALTALNPDPALTEQSWQFKMVGLGSLVIAALSPWFFWRFKKYQHDNYALGTQQTSFDAGIGSFYKLAAKVFGIYVVTFALIPIAIVVLTIGTKAGHSGTALEQYKQIAGFVTMLLLLMTPLVVGIYVFVIARTQDLMWNHTESSHIRFISALRFRSLFWLTLKNWICMLFTLGLFWPFAAVALQRLRIEAISVEMAMPPEELVADSLEHAEDATGLAAGDFFGFDVGL